eukprot:361845-Chlamydomonas_euryale.AAC.3
MRTAVHSIKSDTFNRPDPNVLRAWKGYASMNKCTQPYQHLSCLMFLLTLHLPPMAMHCVFVGHWTRTKMATMQVKNGKPASTCKTKRNIACLHRLTLGGDGVLVGAAGLVAALVLELQLPPITPSSAQRTRPCAPQQRPFQVVPRFRLSAVKAWPASRHHMRNVGMSKAHKQHNAANRLLRTARMAV